MEHLLQMLVLITVVLIVTSLCTFGTQSSPNVDRIYRLLISYQLMQASYVENSQQSQQSKQHMNNQYLQVFQHTKTKVFVFQPQQISIYRIEATATMLSLPVQ
jgi:hypothetical protein